LGHPPYNSIDAVRRHQNKKALHFPWFPMTT
jgi:hypothetical protein